MNRDDVKAEVINEMIAGSEARISQLRAELAEEELVLAAIQKRRGARPTPATLSETNGVNAEDTTDERMEEGKVPQLIVAVLREVGHKLPARVIVREVESKGATSSAKKGISAVVASSLARRADLFIRVSRGVYDLRERHKGNVNANGG